MNYLATHHTHPTVEEVFLALKRTPYCQPYTVYNTLRMLSEHGAASMITIDDHRVCYDGVTEPHAHFFCKALRESISTLRQWKCHVIQAKSARVSELTITQLYYKGICPDCLKAIERGGRT